MTASSSWHRLGTILHGMSYLKLAFYAVGLYFQLQAMVFGSRAAFEHNFYSCLLMYGLAMLMEALRDNEKVARIRFEGKRSRIGKMQWVVAAFSPVFALVVGQGLFMLYRMGDKFLGEAIIVFGIGGLALMRLEYDCICLALAEGRTVEAPLPAPVPASPAPEKEPALQG
jgi:hypothetical protein